LETPDKTKRKINGKNNELKEKEDPGTHDKMPVKDQFNSLDQIQEDEQKPSPNKVI